MGLSAVCDCGVYLLIILTYYLLYNVVVIIKNMRMYNYPKNESGMFNFDYLMTLPTNLQTLISNTKLVYNLGYFRLASETPFEWRFNGGPIVLVL